jgi:hypothetical protein
VALAAAALVVAGMAVLVLGGSDGGAAAGSTTTGGFTGKVERRTLAERLTAIGTIGYAGEATVLARLSGTVTALPAVGDVVCRGERLYALAGANDVLVEQEWAAFSLRVLVERLVAPYRDPVERVSVRGPEVNLPPRLNVPLALVLHELATNAAKYGALAAEDGSVAIEWREVETGIELVWAESGGAAVEGPLTKSFGMRLISEILPVELGAVDYEVRAEGVRCRILLGL